MSLLTSESVKNATTIYRKKVTDMPLDEAYFVWLYSQVGSVETRNKSRTYWALARLLHQKEFAWSHIDRDENRAHDGTDLRRQFLNEKNLKPQGDFLAMPCSMLELLVAMAFKLEWDSFQMTQPEWFWHLIENIGLLEYNDANPPDEEEANDILDRIINREYEADGAGGLFPLRNPQEDQRSVELAYQAQAYLLERI